MCITVVIGLIGDNAKRAFMCLWCHSYYYDKLWNFLDIPACQQGRYFWAD